MTQLRYLVLILCGLCIALSARPVWAQDDDPTVEMARQRFKEGIDFFDAKQFTKARAAFLQAYALKKHPAVLLNLAQSELRSGHEADAADHFSEYLRTAKEARAEERQAATTGLFDAKRMVAEVTVNVDEADADILVDGKARGTSPLPGPIYLVPGSHTLTARKAGKEVTSTINVEAGDSTSTKLSLKLQPEGEEALPGATDDGGAAKYTEAPKAEAKKSSKNVGHWFATHPVAWLTTGLAVGGIGGGIAFSLASKSSYAHADETAVLIENEAKKDMEPPTGICTRIGDISAQRGPARANDYKHACDIYKDNVNNGDAMKIASIVGFSLGGAAAVGTVIYYVVDTSHSDDSDAVAAKSRAPVEHVTVTPSVGPSYAGLSVSGSF